MASSLAEEAAATSYLGARLARSTTPLLVSALLVCCSLHTTAIAPHACPLPPSSGVCSAANVFFFEADNSIALQLRCGITVKPGVGKYHVIIVFVL